MFLSYGPSVPRYIGVVYGTLVLLAFCRLAHRQGVNHLPVLARFKVGKENCYFGVVKGCHHNGAAGRGEEMSVSLDEFHRPRLPGREVDQSVVNPQHANDLARFVGS